MTVNNWTPDDYESCKALMHDNTIYSILCKEVGKKSGVPHLHLWVHFPNPREWRAMKKRLPRANIQYGKGEDTQVRDYLVKEDDYVESGTPSVGQGSRLDLHEAVSSIVEHGKMRDVIEQVNYQVARHCELVLKYKGPVRTWKPEVYWYWGQSGTGKTEAAFAESDPEDRWVSGRDLRWFEGYDGHSDVIIDDFRGDFCKFHELLKILDRYECRVENKGGSRQFLARRIWITSWYSPETVYNTREDVYQLLRRITVAKRFGTEVLEQKSGVILAPTVTHTKEWEYQQKRFDDFESYELNHGIYDDDLD